MAQISIWGVQHGLGVTSNVAALATLIGMEYQVRTLVTQPQWSDTTLEHAFKKSLSRYNRELMNISGTGLDALERLVRSGKCERDSVKNNSLIIEKDRLEILSGTEKLNKEEFERSEAIFNVIFDKAKEYYEALIVDLHAGNNSNIVQTTIQQSDLVIVCLNQNIHVLEKYFNKENWPEALHDKPHLLLIGQYDSNSKYKVKNIASLFNYNKPILTIPYSSEFRDAFNDGNVKGFFMQNQMVSKNHKNYYFMQQVRQAVKIILTEIGVNVTSKVIERGAS